MFTSTQNPMSKIVLCVFHFILITALTWEMTHRVMAQIKDLNDDFFIEVLESSLTSEQTARLVKVRERKTTDTVRIANIRNIFELLQSTTPVHLNIFPGKRFEVRRNTIELSTNSEFTWIGAIPEHLGSVVFVKTEMGLTGTVRVGRELYEVEPLGAGTHVIIRVDRSQFPPEHPVEYEEGSLQESLSRTEAKPRDKVSLHSGETISLNSTNTVIGVLVAYTDSAASAHGDINGLIETARTESNQSYQNSDIDITLSVVHKVQVDYTESGSFSTDLSWFREDPDIADLRNQYSADVAVLIINDPDDCGLAAAIPANKFTAFCVVHYDCAAGNYSFGHEVGHLQGARHQPQEDPSTTPFPYGHGFAYPAGEWRTVMATDGPHTKPCFGECARIKYWSNPLKSYYDVDMGSTDKEDNARVLNETAQTVAAFRVLKVADFISTTLPSCEQPGNIVVGDMT